MVREPPTPVSPHTLANPESIGKSSFNQSNYDNFIISSTDYHPLWKTIFYQRKPTFYSCFILIFPNFALDGGSVMEMKNKHSIRNDYHQPFKLNNKNCNINMTAFKSILTKPLIFLNLKLIRFLNLLSVISEKEGFEE